MKRLLVILVAAGLCLVPTAAAAGQGAGVTLEGTYRLLHGDGRPGGPSTTLDYLEVGRSHYLLQFAQRPTLHPGERLRVEGTAAAAPAGAGPALAVSSVEHVAATTTTAAATTGTTRVLVVLADWTAPDAVTPASASAQLFGTDSAWYREASYGATTLAGDVTPWLSIAAPVDCDAWAIMDEAQTAARAHGFDPALYDRTMVYFPWYTPCGYFAGMAEVSGTRTWINGYLDTRVTVHELGHNYGLWHSHSYRCVDAGGAEVPFGPSCSSDEYGDMWDAMGNGFTGVGHFNAAQKDLLGWMTGRVATVSAAGSYRLLPIEGAAAGIQALKVPTADEDYWIEYRQPQGADAFMSGFPGSVDGVTVHVPWSGNGTWLLDMKPGTGAGFGDSALARGQSYLTPEGVRLTVTAADAAGATVTIGFAPVNAVLPAIPGSPIVGRAVTAGTGSWSNGPTGYSYEFRSCNAAGADCSPIAGLDSNASWYTPRAADVGHTLRVAVTASNAAGAGTAAVSNATPAVVTGVPVDVTPPQLPTGAVVGRVLFSGTGGWTNTPTEYRYEFRSCDAAGGSCRAIAGLDSKASWYTPRAADLGRTLRVAVTAVNGAGSGTPAVSGRTAVVVAGLPVNVTPPTISPDAPLVGHAVTAGTGTWTNTPTDYRYAFQTCDATGSRCTRIDGLDPSASWYTPRAADVGRTLRVEVTAGNAVGVGAPATSRATAVVR